MRLAAAMAPDHITPDPLAFSGDATQSPRVVALMGGCSRQQGGMFHSIRHLWQHVAALGVPVSVHGLEDDHSSEDAALYAPVPATAHAKTFPYLCAHSAPMRRAVRTLAKPGAVFSLHGLWEYPSYAALMARRAGCPLVIQPHGMIEPWALAHGRWKKRLAGLLWHNALLHGATCFRALTGAERDQVRALGMGAPVAVIPNGIVLDERPAPPRTEANAAIPGLAGAPYFLFLSRMHPKKGVPELLRAWREASAAEPAMRELKLVIAGPDRIGHTIEMMALARDLGLEAQVVFPGALYDEAKRAAMAHAGAFLLPSHSEGFSIAILEAAAAGLPVLMTPGCNFPELEAAGAARVSPAEERPLAGALMDLASLTAAERQTMGQAGRRLVSSHYCWPQIAAQMSEVIHWMAEGADPGRRPGCVCP